MIDFDWIWLLVFVLAALLFIVLHVLVLPRCFLRIRFRAQMEDRGIKNVNEGDGGHTVICAPAQQYRRYLKHYALSHRQNGVQLICDFDKSVAYASFNVAIYDGTGQVCKVLEVKQSIVNGESEEIALPPNTAYVSVKLKEVDGVKFDGSYADGVPTKSVLLFVGICALLELFILFIVKVCLAKTFGGLFAESFMDSPENTVITLIIGVILVAINGILTAVVIKCSKPNRS